MERTEQLKVLARRFFDILGSGDVEALMAMYDPEGTCWTSGSTLISGTMDTQTIRQGATAIFDAFPEGIHFTVHAMTAEGDRVAVEAESLGRHVSGRTYNNHYHFLLEFRGDRLLRLKEYMDTELVTDILCGGQRPEGVSAG